MNAGLILAGGKGERLPGYGMPKQFIEVGGRMVISYCLGVFESCPAIDLICVVAAGEWRARIGDYIFADAGISRQHSIYNGLLALSAYAPDYIVVHDAARPLVTEDDISGLFEFAADFDGATPMMPVTETIYRSGDGKTIGAALNRDELFLGQTPESYDYKRYLAAHERFSASLGGFRGSSEIAVRAGMNIAIAKGNPGNFKITTGADLDRFRAIIEKGLL